jgi:hypothetical protein
MVSVQDLDKTKISDYGDGTYGFKYAETNADRHYIIVQNIEKRDDPVINTVVGGGPYTLTASAATTNSQAGNIFTDSAGNRYTIDSVDEETDEIVVSDDLGAGTAPITGQASIIREYPAEDAAFDAQDDIPIFIGFNRKGARLNLEEDRVEITYDGIERILNDMTVNGVVSLDTVVGVNKNVNANSFDYATFSYQHKAVFNKGGRPDKFEDSQLIKNIVIGAEGTGKGEQLILPFFNIVGAGVKEFWSIYDIINYLYYWYIGNPDIPQFNRELVFPDEFDYIVNFNHFIAGIDFGEVGNELKEIIINDFVIENMGVWDALQKTLDASGKYVLGWAYNVNGKVELKIDRKTDRTADNLPMLLSRNDFEAAYDGKKIVEDGSLYINRESSQVGRVIVLGRPITLNTAASTFIDNKDLARKDPSDDQLMIFSQNPVTYVEPGIGYIKKWYNYLHLIPVNETTVEKGPKAISYIVSNYPWAQTRSKIPPPDLPINKVFLNEESSQKIFKQFQFPEIIQGMATAFSDFDIAKKNTTAYVSDVIVDIDGEDLDMVNMIPSEQSEVFSFGIIKGFRGGGILKEKNNESQKYEDLEDASPLEPAVNGDLFFDTPVTKVVPFVLNLQITTGYNIRGIAKISGYDPHRHSTIVVRDDRFGLSLNYANVSYSDGGFYPVTDGFIPLTAGGSDPEEKNTLEKIQKLAEDLLYKYVSVTQNSGGFPVTGIQEAFWPNDYITEIEGNGRTFDFPTVINEVEFDIDNRITFLTFGAINET